MVDLLDCAIPSACNIIFQWFSTQSFKSVGFSSELTHYYSLGTAAEMLALKRQVSYEVYYQWGTPTSSSPPSLCSNSETLLILKAEAPP